MKAKPDGTHLAGPPRPGIDGVPDGRGVLVEDCALGQLGRKETNAGEYGAPRKSTTFW